MLASAPLTIQSGSLAQNLQVEAPFSWTSANALTLDSYRAITVDQPVSDAGPAALTITTNDGGAGGTLFFGTKGSIGFLSTANALTINGLAYKLEANLKNLAFDIARKPAGSFALANAYDASADGLYLLSPVTTTLRGNFTGLGNTISKLTIADGGSDAVGLFAATAGRAVVSGVRLKSEVVRGPESTSVGGLAGINEGVIDNVEVNGVAAGGAYTGLIVGLNIGSVTNAATEGAVHGGSAGGLVGNGGGTISSSQSSAKVTGDYAGGLYGGSGNYIGTISLSRAYGSITADIYAGGLVGCCANIDASFAAGSVEGKNKREVFVVAGGLLGYSGFNQIKVSNSYAIGNVKTKDYSMDGGYTGGLVGYNISPISESYSIGNVGDRKGAYAGASVGVMDVGSGVANIYWDKDTARTKKGVGSGPKKGVKGLTDAELKSGLPAGFDPNVWAENPNINNGFPYLIANPPGK